MDAKFGKKTVFLEELTLTLVIDTSRLSGFSDTLKKSLKEALSSIEKKDRVASKTIYRKRLELKANQVFLYFLKNGRMPWFSASFNYREADFSDVDFKEICLKLLKDSARARQRLIQQLPRVEAYSVMTALYASKFVRALFELERFVTEHTQQYSDRYAAGFRLGQFLLILGLEYLQKETGTYVLSDFVKRRRNDIAAEIKRECNGKHSFFLEFIEEELLNHYHTKIDFGERASDVPAVSHKMDAPIEKRIPEAREQLMNDFWSKTGEESQQLVWNTGIVLLHPFIKRFFNKVGVLENGRFISTAHQQRAICLLHNLATGELVFPEEKLLFFKFLCHYPLDKPIPKELPISAFELEEVQNVLRSAIAHWTALKRTSIAGLRMNFIQRKGLLEKDALGYTLHVERHTADILLDQLPWGLSAAHWSWLPHVLTIKWR